MTLARYVNSFDVGGMNPTLEAMYGAHEVNVQRQRYLRVLRRMERWTNCDDVVLVTAPGRTELGGNHTDHNQGIVLAAAVHLDCIAVATATNRNVIRIMSEGFAETIEVDLDDLNPRVAEEGTTHALVRGILHGFQTAGYAMGPFDACVACDVPVGTGLSSSAAFEICIGRILSHLFNQGEVPAMALARIGQQAENEYFGKPCGLMDQMACAVQGVVSIDFGDPASPAVMPVDADISASGYELVVVDTGGSHVDLTPDYAAIPAEMQRAAQVFGQQFARGLTVAQVLESVSKIRAVAGDRGVLRLIHFIEESDRAVRQAESLSQHDMATFLRLVRESGDSSWRLLQNCISSERPLQQSIPLALTVTERFLGSNGAWRIQGGGFAGTIQAYVPKERLEEYVQFMSTVFGKGAVVPLRLRFPGFECVQTGLATSCKR